MSTEKLNGTIGQSALYTLPGDYGHERIYYPVVGVVINVHASDDPFNAQTIPTANQRGPAHTADVYVVAAGNDNPWTIPNVVILPRGPSGADSYSEDLPRPATMMLDGSQFTTSSPGGVDLTQCDGDWCVVAFIGGSIQFPVMISWFPHPGNRSDPATFGFPLQPAPASGSSDAGTLKQGFRSFRRTNGLKRTVTADGSLYVDTNESNAQLVAPSDGQSPSFGGVLVRKPVDAGGDIQVDVKPQRQLQVNFNPPVALPQTAPSTPQPNPPASQTEQQRETSATAVTLDKDTIALIAGEVAKIITNDKNIQIHAKTQVTVMGENEQDNTVLGSEDASQCDHAVCGETFLQQRYDALVELFNTHVHPTAVGPTDVPTAVAQAHQPADLSSTVLVKRSG